MDRNVTRYTIRSGQTADGSPWFSVVEYIGDVCMGGDHHWLRREFADAALKLYLRGERFPLRPAHIAEEELA